jgi:hypothetical protein
MYLRNAVILVLLQSNSSGFVPVEFSRARCSIGKQHCGDPFALPPPSTSILFPQTRDLANATIERSRLDLSDVAENSKAHTPATFQRIIGREIGPVSRHSLYHFCGRGGSTYFDILVCLQRLFDVSDGLSK